MTLEQLIEERIRIDYSGDPQLYIKGGIGAQEDLLGYKILSLISEEDKEALYQELLANKKRVLEAEKVARIDAVSSIDAQLANINAEIK